MRYKSLALLLAACLLLTGCRSSPVLEEVVYTQEAPTVDLEQEMLDPEDEGEEDEQFHNETVEDVQTERDTAPETGVYDEEDSGVQDAVDVDAGNNNLESYDTSEGSGDRPNQTESTSNSGSSGTTGTSTVGSQTQQTGDETASGLDGSAGEGDGGKSGENGENGDAVSDEIEEPEPSEEPEVPQDEPEVYEEPTPEIRYRQILDATGAYVDIPEDVEFVTAVDSAAQFVEMLGGPGRLVGADTDFVYSSLAQYCFSDVAGGAVAAWWNGSSISDDALFALMASGVQVCFVFSGKSLFTEGQLEQLRSHEGGSIAVVTLYPTSSYENMEYNASIVGQVLGGDAESNAASYNSWVESVRSDVQNATSGNSLTSLYISEWDYDAFYQLNNTGGVIASSGYGLAVGYAPGKAALMTTSMNTANVVNETCDTTYLQNKMRDINYVYVTPMFHQFNPAVSGSRASYISSSVYAAAYDLFVSRLIGGGSYYQLGSSAFPAVIVSDQSVKQELENNWFWQYHETDASGYVTVEGNRFYCGVVGSYEIFVNPSGMCDWTEGSVEAPLEAYWVACKLQGAYSIDQVKSKTNEFYQQFFGVALSDSQLLAIFGE